MFQFAFRGLCAALVLCAATSVAQARPLTVEQKMADFQQLLTSIDTGYGPKLYKQSVMGINLESIKAQYLEKIKASKTNGEFYYLIVQFVAEFKDSHFGARLPTTQVADLFFATDLVEGKVVIDTINRKKLDEAKFPFVRGDEIVEVDSKPVMEVVDELKKYMSTGFDFGRTHRAAYFVSWRPGSVVPVPTGNVTLKIRRGTSSVFQTVTLPWTISGEPMDEVNQPNMLKLAEAPASRNYHDLSLDTDQLRSPEVERGFRCSGTTRIAIPEGATMIMDTPIVAYYYPTPKGNVGYLRIPEYIAANPTTGVSEYELRFKQYEYAVAVLEKNTVGLIIDQDHNCGGSVAFLHRMVGLFMDKPFKPMEFELLATKEEYLSFKKWLGEMADNTLEKMYQLQVLDLIKHTWLNTTDFLTPKIGIDGNFDYYPNGVRYTKPIVMLIDDQSGSGGDAFPAMMGGYGRATLLGTRTVGAGGHVEEIPSLHNSGITVRMTKSLFYRPDGVPVENNGAVPHIPYTLTWDDFTYGYQGYRAFYTAKLLELVN